jgi:DUF2934 family protein
MPKATRANDGTTPKKRSRKTTPEVGNGTQSDSRNATQAAQPVTTSPEFAHGSHLSPVVEEKIRARAYELYLQRRGHGGSPEQDWLRAKEEICGQQRTA